MFNAKKFAEKEKAKKSVKPLSVMNDEQNKKDGLDAPKSADNFNKLLEKDRKEQDGMDTYEKLLDEVRVEKDANTITEKQLDEAKKGINGMEHRVEETASPLMDYSKESQVEQEKEFKEAQDKDLDTGFWDDFVGDQMLGESTKIVSNNQNSQLVSNYETREDFEKTNKSAKVDKKASVDMLRDADAMLYYIYKQAAVEKREVNEQEKQMINDINSGKIRVLADLQSLPLDEELRVEDSTIAADDLEQENKDKEDVGLVDDDKKKRDDILRAQEEIAF